MDVLITRAGSFLVVFAHLNTMVSAFKTESLCFQDNFHINCSKGVIAIEGVKAGAKPTTTTCSSTECCMVDAGDCMFDYTNIQVLKTFRCNGEASCDPSVPNALTPAQCSPGFSRTSNYMYILYSCVDKSTISSVCPDTMTNHEGPELHIWNQGFPEDIRHSDTLCEAFVITTGASLNIEIDTIQRELASDGSCSLMWVYPINYNTDVMPLETWTCENNTYTVETLNVSLPNVTALRLLYNRSFGAYWFRIRDMDGGNITLQSSQVEDQTTTPEPTTITTSEPTTTTPDLTTPEPTTITPESTTTKADDFVSDDYIVLLFILPIPVIFMLIVVVIIYLLVVKEGGPAASKVAKPQVTTAFHEEHFKLPRPSLQQSPSHWKDGQTGETFNQFSRNISQTHVISSYDTSYWENSYPPPDYPSN